MVTHLFALWEQYLAEPAWIPVDRWLAGRLRRIDGMSRADRLWIGERILDACRFGALVLFCEIFLGKRRAEAADVHGAIRRFAGEVPRASAAVAGLRRIRPADVFFWLARRASVRPRTRPPTHALWVPGHPARGAPAAWDRLAAFFQHAEDVDSLLAWNRLGPWLKPFIVRRARTAGWDHARLKEFLGRHAAASPLWLRLSTPAEAAPVTAELSAHGLRPVYHPPRALRVSGSEGIPLLGCYRKGQVEIQDLASQQIGWATRCRPGMFVWDACAGGGGKTLQLASMLDGRGAVYASDVNGKKLDILRRRVRRCGLGDTVRVVPWDGKALPGFPKEIAARSGFDCVLVDAPCSGSGTWRRNPDGRLFFDADRLPQLRDRQLRILSAASAAVRPGGTLVYATCSIHEEENEEVGRRFLRQAAAFTLLSMELFGNPLEDADTTFAAVFLRKRDGPADGPDEGAPRV